MADQQSNETIRQMMSGFSAMQFNLGLLPMPQAQAMAGAGAQYQTPPPPPRVPHPSEAAMNAMAVHQNMMQQTLQTAQMTRYAPPPSAPIGAMSAYAPSGGYVSPLGGGGGGFGGGAPSPFVGGGFGGNHAAPFSPRLPSIFNPFAPTLPTAHFATPAMRNQQLMQHAQAQTMGMMAGVGEAGMGVGGSALGGMIGSAFGPLGTLAGSFLGGKVGGAVSNMIFNPVTQDYARGRQIQQMTSPFMVTGPNMNTATGAGLDPRAARDVASGIRHLARDPDFERTGFNSQDAMRIMQTSASAGLLTGATSPDQLVQRVKDISKTVKVLMKITGDPDVRDAIHSLGQMRDMGFNGLASQAGAVANRMSFARMAGQSSAQMQQTMMAGGDMAGQYGLVGATGAMAGGFGAGAANVAASSGALNDLQMARAGGRAGLGQINTMGALSAMNNEQYMLAAMGRDSKGRMTVDMGAFRKAQTMSFGDVQEKAADALRNMGTQGIFEWNTRRQEFKDQIAQKLHPGEMQMMMMQQAKAFQNAVPGMSLGTAIEKTTGMNASQARALELQMNSRGYWQGLANQTRIDRRDLVDQEKAQREQYRTPGMMTRAGRWGRGVIGGIGDAVSSPFRSIADHFDRMHEDDDAAEHGEHIRRYGDSQMASTSDERDLLRSSIREGGLRGSYNRGGGSMGPAGVLGAVDRQVNRMTSFMGFSSKSNANRMASVADYSRGRYTSLGETFGDSQDALKRVQDVIDVSRAISAPALTAQQNTTMFQRIGDAGGPGKKFNAMDIISRATVNMLSTMGTDGRGAGLIKSASAMDASSMKQHFVDAAMKGSNSMTKDQAEAAWEGSKSQIMKRMSETVYASGDQKKIEQFEKDKDVEMRAGGVDLKSDHAAAKAQIADELGMAGMGGMSDKATSEIKALVAQNKGPDGDDIIALAVAERGLNSSDEKVREQSQRTFKEIEAKHGKEKAGQLQEKATRIAGGLSGETAGVLTQAFKGTQDLSGVEKTIGLGRKGLGHTLELAARDEFSSKLAKQTGRKDLEGMSTDKALASLSADEIDKLDPTLKAAVMKYRESGDRSGVDEEVAKSGPTSGTTRHSGASSDKLRELDERIASYEDQAAKSTDDGTPESLQAKASDLFANAVSDFVGAVRDLKGSSENDRLDRLSVSRTSQNGEP